MSTWQAVWQAIADDFSDLPDATQFTRITVRLVMAAVLGGAIGYEREQKRKAAGFRTHILVAIGAALLVLVVQQAGGTSTDVARVIQGLVTGIGFLGAGTILNGRQEKDIQGLTTAASIWFTAAVGVAAGLGREVYRGAGNLPGAGRAGCPAAVRAVGFSGDTARQPIPAREMKSPFPADVVLSGSHHQSV